MSFLASLTISVSEVNPHFITIVLPNGNICDKIFSDSTEHPNVNVRLAALTLAKKLRLLCNLFDRYECHRDYVSRSSEMEIKILLNTANSYNTSQYASSKSFPAQAIRFHRYKVKKPQWRPMLPVIEEVVSFWRSSLVIGWRKMRQSTIDKYQLFGNQYDDLDWPTCESRQISVHFRITWAALFAFTEPKSCHCQCLSIVSRIKPWGLEHLSVCGVST